MAGPAALAALLVPVGAADATWTRHDVPPPPAGRIAAAACTDRVRGTVVVFGGLGGGDQTWLWDGASWTEAQPATRPPGRVYGSMVYDPEREVSVLFGGDDRGPTLFGDTWIWDGTDWTDVTPPGGPTNSPSGRTFVPLAFHEATGRVVLFGGWDGGPLGDTWTWDGASWTQESPATSPPPRYWAAMADGPGSDPALLFGGFGTDYLDDTWRWDGATWSQHTLVPRPDPRTGTRMTREPGGDVLLYGGAVPAVGGGVEFRDDLWRWNGLAWSQLSPPLPAPGPRQDPVLAGLGASGHSILFSGAATGVLYDDTWTFDGTGWTFVPRTAPQRRDQPPCAYDPWRDEVVLFGGFTAFGETDDTWIFDGAAWDQRVPSAAPPPRSDTKMVFDAVRGTCLLFGGRSGSVNQLGDTWSWDGASWTQLLPPASPTPRRSMMMVYDDARANVVLFGGYDGGSLTLDDTWTWDGVTWAPQPATGPVRRLGAYAAYDPMDERVVMFGGRTFTTPTGTQSLNDTWVWDGATWTELLPADAPSPRAFGSMAFDGANMLLHGGVLADNTYLDETWLFTGGTWVELGDIGESPGALAQSCAVHDAARGRVVLFSGRVGPRSDDLRADTWLWNGTDVVGVPGGEPDEGGVDAGGVEAGGLLGVSPRLTLEPNPMFASTVIGFELPAAADVVLEVFDVTGRLAARLHDGLLPAGDHHVRWDGRGSNGRRTPPGVYHVSLRGDGASARGTLILLR